MRKTAAFSAGFGASLVMVAGGAGLLHERGTLVVGVHKTDGTYVSSPGDTRPFLSTMKRTMTTNSPVSGGPSPSTTPDETSGSTPPAVEEIARPDVLDPRAFQDGRSVGSRFSFLGDYVQQCPRQARAKYADSPSSFSVYLQGCILGGQTGKAY